MVARRHVDASTDRPGDMPSAAFLQRLAVALRQKPSHPHFRPNSARWSRTCLNRAYGFDIKDLVAALTYTARMMTRHSLTLVAAMALAMAGTALASAQGYPPAQSSSPYYGNSGAAAHGYDRQQADLSFDDGFDDAGRPAVAAAPQGPVLSPDDPRYGRPLQHESRQPVAHQGPILSPDDPRYGRPAGAPPIYASQPPHPGMTGSPDGLRPPGAIGPHDGTTGAINPNQPTNIAALPPEDQPEVGVTELAPNLRRQEVDFVTKEPPGTIVVDTDNTYLYYVLGGGRAIRYGVRVGREGFTWAGTQKITRKAEWPDWHPPVEMIERQPYLPRFMAGGPSNPMGARAMYLGNTVYRIHGTNQPSTIGKFVSSGCIGMLNDDVSDLYERAKQGTRVVVWPSKKPKGAVAATQPAPNATPVPRDTLAAVPGTAPTVVPPLPEPVSIR
jgi:lipoprotein-anchoring transpeptidase ErfK/SrfK